MPRGNPHGNPNPNIDKESPNGKTPETNEDSIGFVMEYMRWPVVDLADPEAVQQRVMDYFELCREYNTKPLVSALCVVLGTNRGEVLNWSAGKATNLGRRLSPESEEVVKTALENLEVFWEFAMQNNGYRNPVTGIFLGKNNFNYKDTSETVVKHQSSDVGPTKAQLEAKYQDMLPAQDVHVEYEEPKRLSGGD